MSGTPLASYDHGERCWKTSEATSLWALTLSSLTLPSWGCLHDGVLYELPTPERPTIEPGFSSLPTPVADNSRGLPNQGDYQSLSNALLVLPTPAVNDMGAGKDPQAWDEWAARQKAADGRPAPHGKSLEQEALRVGATTHQPLTAGSTSSDAQHQPPLFNEQDEIA